MFVAKRTARVCTAAHFIRVKKLCFCNKKLVFFKKYNLEYLQNKQNYSKLFMYLDMDVTNVI